MSEQVPLGRGVSVAMPHPPRVTAGTGHQQSTAGIQQIFAGGTNRNEGRQAHPRRPAGSVRDHARQRPPRKASQMYPVVPSALKSHVYAVLQSIF